MPVTVPGFKGGDRTSILLPAIQTELMKALKATGKPVIFVMLTGSALAIPWEDENIPAIMNAWYGGQSGGTAVADVLFGDYNPAGRLPVTFYKSDNDLPDFSDYSMKGRTYRYFEGKALYPFGYGLSFTRFRYAGLKTTPVLKKGKNLSLSFTLTNSGSRDGEEVIQLYVSHSAAVTKPLKALKAFRRVHLKKGETRVFHFTLTPEDLSLVDDNGKMVQPAGKLTISIGGGQPGTERETGSNIISKTISVL